MDISAKIPGHNITYGEYAAWRMRSRAGGSETLGPEIHVNANAASDPNGNEADATTGWTQVGLDAGANVFESQGAVKSTGSYAFHANSNDTPTSAARFLDNFLSEVGETYKVTFDWRHVGSGDPWRLLIEGVQVVSITSAQTTFESKVYYAVAGDTSFELRFQENGGGNNGGVYVDNISLKKVL